MAQDLGLDFAAGPSVSGLFGSTIAAGASQTSNAIDLGAPTPLAVGIEAKIVTGTGTPDGAQACAIFIQWSHDNSDFDDATNDQLVQTLRIGAASTTFIQVRSVPVQARYCKVRVLNDQTAGPAIQTTSVITLTDVFGDQV